MAKRMTKKSIVNAYKELFATMGHNNTIETFGLCSDYGMELDGSTIDKIEMSNDGRVYFYYNQNTNDLDPIECFSVSALKSFYDGLIEAWNEENN